MAVLITIILIVLVTVVGYYLYRQHAALSAGIADSERKQEQLRSQVAEAKKTTAEQVKVYETEAAKFAAMKEAYDKAHTANRDPGTK